MTLAEQRKHIKWLFTGMQKDLICLRDRGDISDETQNVADCCLEIAKQALLGNDWRLTAQTAFERLMCCRYPITTVSDLSTLNR